MRAPTTSRPPRCVLVLARHFPPVGGAGVQRTVGSVRYLPRHGYQPVVVTARRRALDRWSPQDARLLDQIPPGTPVHRIDDVEQTRSTRFGACVERMTPRTPLWIRKWVERATAEGIRQGAAAGVDLVLASCLPYETAEAGARVAAALGVPWVADLEDPWALDEMRVQPTAIHQAVDLRRMRSCLSSASAIIMCAPEAAARLQAAMPQFADRVTSIPIGFEPADFEGPIAEGTGVFRIVHAGSLHTELGRSHRRSHRRRVALRGTALDVDILTRSHVFLMEAIDRLIALEPELEPRIELLLVGAHTAADDAAAAGRSYVQMVDHLPHHAVIAMMRGADLLFLPMHELPPGRRAGLIPYKTYEYLAAGRPILAAVPDGDVRDLMSTLDRASVVRPADVAGMSLAIHKRITQSRVDDVDSQDGASISAGFARARQVERIAGVLDGVLERQDRSSRAGGGAGD